MQYSSRTIIDVYVYLYLYPTHIIPAIAAAAVAIALAIQAQVHGESSTNFNDLFIKCSICSIMTTNLNFPITRLI